MDQVIVTLEGADHKIGEDETTLCGVVVPHGSTREEGTAPCEVCFPETAKPKKAKKDAGGA